MRLATGLGPLMTAAAEALFPPGCPICRIETGAAGSLCPSCWQEVGFLQGAGCTHCARPITGATPEDGELICEECLRNPPVWQRGAAAFRYEGAGRRLVLGLKHGDRLDTVAMLGAWMVRAGAHLLDGADLVAPVPLHWRRRLKRRGNQAAELARWLCAARGKRAAFAPRLLVRTRRTASQDGKNRAARVANLDGALAPGPEAGAMRGRRVLLVDDVLTTGATLNAAAQVCLDAGAAAVDILVLALVVRDEHRYMPAVSEDEDHETD